MIKKSPFINTTKDKLRINFLSVVEDSNSLALERELPLPHD